MGTRWAGILSGPPILYFIYWHHGMLKIEDHWITIFLQRAHLIFAIYFQCSNHNNFVIYTQPPVGGTQGGLKRNLKTKKLKVVKSSKQKI